jgi:hypothetical protein
VEIDAREQGMMIRSEDARPPVPGVLVQPVDPALSNDGSLAIPDQEIIEDQARKRVKSVPPSRQRRGHAESEAGLAEQSPGPLVPAAPEIEIGAKNDGIVGNGA